MYKQIIDYILYTFLKHKAVNCVKYQNRILTNAQNNNSYMQVVIDSTPYWSLLTSVTGNPFIMELNIDIMSFVTDEYKVLDAQNDAFQIAVEFIHYFDEDEMFLGSVSVRDYQMVGFDHYTDDVCAGVRLTIQFNLADPVNLCEYVDNFSEDFIPEEVTDKDIDLKDVNHPSEKNELVLKPIRLKSKL